MDDEIKHGWWDQTWMVRSNMDGEINHGWWDQTWMVRSNMDGEIKHGWWDQPEDEITDLCEVWWSFFLPLLKQVGNHSDRQQSLVRQPESALSLSVWLRRMTQACPPGPIFVLRVSSCLRAPLAARPRVQVKESADLNWLFKRARPTGPYTYSEPLFKTGHRYTLPPLRSSNSRIYDSPSGKIKSTRISNKINAPINCPVSTNFGLLNISETSFWLLLDDIQWQIFLFSVDFQ